ncbi:MAG: substrate-binding domain-containing protein [Clostridia bacterium]|nr:substrate-binding domain-containing protein [Clostridia bacterium]
MKKLFSVLLVALLVAGLMTSALAGTADGKKIALVGKSAGNAFFEIAAAAFKEAGEAEGATIDVVYPEEATADAQIKVLDNLISQQPDAICISANDFNALQAKLEEAMDAGIKVSSFDSAPNPASRQVFVNQAGTVAVGQALIDAVYDMAGGEGQWAVLSATSQAANQNAWIDAMKKLAEDEKYAKLELVEVAYGDDEPQKSTDQTQALLDNYPDLKVICAPTTVGIAAAAKLLQDKGSAVKLTGLGLPSEMLEYTGADEAHSCPYFYLWDMQLLGKLSAYATIALINGDITGAEGESFTVAGLGDFSITKADAGGTEIVQGLPLQLNQDNIEEMAKLY